ASAQGYRPHPRAGGEGSGEMALGLDRLEPECQKVELNPAVAMRLLDRRMTEAASVGGLMLMRLWGPPNFLLWRISDVQRCPLARRYQRDCVEKLICASERERLIQDQVPARNNDSRTGPPRFFYCKFRLHSARSATFSTQSEAKRTQYAQSEFFRL